MGFTERGLFGSKKTFVGNFFDPLGLFPFDRRPPKQSGAAAIESATVPQIAASESVKKRRRVGRNALILTNQEDILGDPTGSSRNVLTAI